MKILITGGAGYIGTDLAYQLSKNKAVDKIIIYDNLSRGNHNLFIGREKFDKGIMEFVKGDILDSRKLNQIVKEVDVVFHLAARVTTPFADQNTHLFEQVNHWGTAELVYAVEKSDVQQFFYLSSASVYGSGEKLITINSPVNPDTYYGTSKLRGEDHVYRLAKKIKTITLRCGNVYGYSKSMRFDAVINKFMFEANFNGKIIIKGNGDQKRAFIRIDKVVDCLNNLISTSFDSGVYNLVDLNLSILDVAEALKALYPKLEMSFVDQHLKLREISVQPDDRLSKMYNFAGKNNLMAELEEFKGNLTF